MKRYADFITYPGTGMWMRFGKYDNSNRIELYRHLTKEQLKAIIVDANWQLYWIDQGIGASTLLRVRNGGRSSSATLVTPAILKRHLKEDGK